jgi:cellulose synthase/poly-beta-1,6-N-acetylglucosamine synthase-like glycosyltransferase
VVPVRVPVRGQILSVHAPRDGRALTVIRKETAGRCAGALNVALNAARTPLVCMVDADSVIEPDALLHVVRPFVEHPDRTVAAGGVIRPSNGVRLRRGSVQSVSAPATLLARIQVVEYLRAFLLGRVGWTWLNGVLIISGAFGIFRRDDVVALGGLNADSLGQDAELVAGLHNSLRRRSVDHRMVIVPQPVCWTQVPETRRELAKQRRRWPHGLAEVLWRQRAAFGRPILRPVRPGHPALPPVVRAARPVVEVLGVPAVIAAWALGLLNGWFAVLVFTISVGFGSMVSMAAVSLDEVTFHRYERSRDLGLLVLAALLESTGLRWLHSWWRLRGLLDAVDPRRRSWGSMSRVSFLTHS